MYQTNKLIHQSGVLSNHTKSKQRIGVWHDIKQDTCKKKHKYSNHPPFKVLHHRFMVLQMMDYATSGKEIVLVHVYLDSTLSILQI